MLPKKKTMCNNGAVIIGGDFQGLGIARNLSYLGIPIFVIDPDFCISHFSRYVWRCYKCPPYTDNEAFVSFLRRLAVENELKKWVLYPTSDLAVYVVSKFKSFLAEYYLISTPEWEITKFAYDKRLTCQLAEKIGLPIPRTAFPQILNQLDSVDLEFPVILKPTVKDNFFSITKRKALRANDKHELAQAYEYMRSIIPPSEIMVQELIQGGPENLYSFCSLFSDNSVKAKIVAKRARQHPMDFGNATTFAISCDVPELERLATKILKAIGYYGLSEVEFMFDPKDKTFKLLEINPRTWGWHTLGARVGVNFSSLLFMDINNMVVPTNSFRKNVKWIRLLTDIPIVISEIAKKHLKIRDYISSMRGEKEFAVYSLKDPLPFIVELIMAPYFWYKRGF